MKLMSDICFDDFDYDREDDDVIVIDPMDDM
jgi:hypothetical protein